MKSKVVMAFTLTRSEPIETATSLTIKHPDGVMYVPTLEFEVESKQDLKNRMSALVDEMWAEWEKL